MTDSLTLATLLQLVGAVLVLAGFAASQLGWVGPRSVAYLVVNIGGAGLLAVLALLDRAWGFLLLEGVWTVVSIVSLVSVLTRRQRSTATGGRR